MPEQTGLFDDDPAGLGAAAGAQAEAPLAAAVGRVPGAPRVQFLTGLLAGWAYTEGGRPGSHTRGLIEKIAARALADVEMVAALDPDREKLLHAK